MTDNLHSHRSPNTRPVTWVRHFVVRSLCFIHLQWYQIENTSISFLQMSAKSHLITRVQTGEKHSQWFMCGLYLPILAVIHGNYSIVHGLAFNLDSVCLHTTPHLTVIQQSNRKHYCLMKYLSAGWNVFNFASSKAVFPKLRTLNGSPIGRLIMLWRANSFS